MQQWGAWRTEDHVENEIFAIGTIKTVSEQIRREQLQKKQNLKLMMKDQLLNIKLRSLQVIYPNVKQVAGSSCKFCSGINDGTQLETTLRRKNLINVLANWKLQYASLCPHLPHCLTLNQFQLTDAIRKEKRQKNRTKDIVKNIGVLISEPLLVFTTWFLYKLIPRFLFSITVHPANIDILKTAAHQKPRTPMVFLPLHRSCFDPILINLVLKSNNIQTPLTILNNSLDLPVIGQVLQRQGAVFVQKYVSVFDGKKDSSYSSAVQSYIHTALQNGQNIQLFLEDEPTSTGKARLPKLGLLSSIIDAYNDGIVSDILIVPISLNYEKLPEDGIVDKMLYKRSRSTLIKALQLCKQLWTSVCGEVRIDFHEPFSLHEIKNVVKVKYNEQHNYPQHHYKRLLHSSTSSLLALDCPEKSCSFTQIVAHHVVYNAINSIPIMSTNAVAFLLLTQFRNSSVTLEELASELEKLEKELILKNIAFNGKSGDVIIYAATLLGTNVIKIEQDRDQILITPVNKVPNILELHYYGNCVSSIFAFDAVVITAVNFLAQKYANYGRFTTEIEVPEYELQDICIHLTDILRYEFIFHKPCQKYENELVEVVTSLCDRGLLFKQVVEATDDQLRANRLAHFLHNDGMVDIESDSESENEEVELYKKIRDSPKLQLPKTTQNKRMILANLIQPIIFCYFTTAECLKQLLIVDCILEVEFVGICIRELTTRVEGDKSKHIECISAETVCNALKLFEKWNVVEISTIAGVRVLNLSQLYNSKISLQSIVNQLKKYYI